MKSVNVVVAARTVRGLLAGMQVVGEAIDDHGECRERGEERGVGVHGAGVRSGREKPDDPARAPLREGCASHQRVCSDLVLNRACHKTQ